MLLACNTPGATSGSSDAWGTASVQTGGGAGAAGSTGRAGAAVGFDSYVVGAVAVNDGPQAGAGGSADEPSIDPIAAPYGISSVCGDGIVGPEEECDDGSEEALDACTSACQTRDQPVSTTPVIDRTLGSGRHPLAGSAYGFVSTYAEERDEGVAVGATVFDIWGHPQLRVNASDGAFPVTQANPVAAALPGGIYALAWTDFDGDGSDLGIALRSLASNGTLGPLRIANASREFSQQNPDLLWTGSELIAVWEDFANAETAPDIRYRRFDAELKPLSDDLLLAGDTGPEAGVALAGYQGGWAVAYREGTSSGAENIVVHAGGKTVRVGPVWGGDIDDRPALAELDATHLVVVFSARTGAADVVSRVFYAVVDAGSGSGTSATTIEPVDGVLVSSTGISQSSPAIERATSGVYVAWRTEARPGDAASDQIWLKHLPWKQRAGATSPQLQADQPEMLIPRVCEGSIAAQRTPALAKTQLPPGGGLVLGWDDYSRRWAAGYGGRTVSLHYAPTHLPQASTHPLRATEDWDAPYNPPGGSFNSHWTTELGPTVTAKNYLGEGRLLSNNAPAAAISTAFMNDVVALNVDIRAVMRMFNQNVVGGLIARRSDDEPGNFLFARYDSNASPSWGIHAVIDGTLTNLAPMAALQNFRAADVYTYHQLRFTARTNADATVFLGMKVWRVGATEPTAWQATATLAADSAAALEFGQRPGRVGIGALMGGSSWIEVDDFDVRYFDGVGAGDLSLAPLDPSAPLSRSLAEYRECRDEAGARCAVGGCCALSDDCAAGLTCVSGLGEAHGVGSHASTCAAGHCGDRTKNADEVRADCGGQDCAACTCTSTVQPANFSYCTLDCLCGIGESDCISSEECVGDLVCGSDNAYLFGAAEGMDACVPAHCMNRVQDGDETAPDCGGSCSKPVAGQPPGSECACSSVNGAEHHCEVRCPCAAGHGDCDYDDECQAGLVCRLNRGVRFPPLGNLDGVCVPAHCVNGVTDAALGETGRDCGPSSGCGACP